MKTICTVLLMCLAATHAFCETDNGVLANEARSATDISSVEVSVSDLALDDLRVLISNTDNSAKKAEAIIAFASRYSREPDGDYQLVLDNLGSDKHRVSQASIMALGLIKNPANLERLLNMARNLDVNARMYVERAYQVMAALVEYDSCQVSEVLVEIMETPYHFPLRQMIVKLLAEQGCLSALESLHRLREDVEGSSIRMEAEIEQHGGEQPDDVMAQDYRRRVLFQQNVFASDIRAAIAAIETR